jgi:hypothetical protein
MVFCNAGRNPEEVAEKILLLGTEVAPVMRRETRVGDTRDLRMRPTFTAR